MSTTRPRTALALSALALGAALTGCSGSDDDGAALAPVSALPPAVQAQVQTDVGEYLATPTSDISKAEIADTVARLKKMGGVQSVTTTEEGKVDLVFLGSSTPAQRQAAVAQLGALGEIEQGI